MQKKTNDLHDAVKKNPPDIKLLQLVLQGSISTQVCFVVAKQVVVHAYSKYIHVVCCNFIQYYYIILESYLRKATNITLQTACMIQHLFYGACCLTYVGRGTCSNN